MGDRLRPLWDFDDLDATQERLRSQVEQEADAAGRAEVLTQLARVAGLRDRFAEGDRLLDEADTAAADALVRARVALERGRLRRSSGDPEAAQPRFEEAFALAREVGHEFLAVDAAHMAALAAPDRDARLAWTERALELAAASGDPEVTYWCGPLRNNLGWEHYAGGEYELALDAFQGALEARQRDVERPAEIEVARYCLGKTLRALCRPAEAATMLEQAVAWTQAVGEPDGWFHEELAEDYAALGRDIEAREQARLAIPLLEGADPSFAGDAERSARLRLLAGV